MPLSEAQIQRAAQRLLDARTNRIRLDDWPEELRPQSTQDAEAICEVMAQGLERPIAGWKVGCADPASPTKLGLERPFCGQIPARLIYASGALIPWGELLRPRV
jgi:2-keto-4-pentenoate hydratase